MRLIVIPLFALFLGACAPEPIPLTGSLPFFGDGYRFPLKGLSRNGVHRSNGRTFWCPIRSAERYGSLREKGTVYRQRRVRA